MQINKIFLFSVIYISTYSGHLICDIHTIFVNIIKFLEIAKIIEIKISLLNWMFGGWLMVHVNDLMLLLISVAYGNAV